MCVFVCVMSKHDIGIRSTERSRKFILCALIVVFNFLETQCMYLFLHQEKPLPNRLIYAQRQFVKKTLIQCNSHLDILLKCKQ